MERDIDRIEKLVAQIALDGRAAWSKASSHEKEGALKIATAEIDRICRFKGHKTDPRQSLSWPRKGVTDKDGNAITGVPKAVEDATCFLAMAHLAGYHLGPENRDDSRALVATLLIMLDGLLEPNNPTQDTGPVH
jgi:hypothetical protein